MKLKQTIQKVYAHAKNHLAAIYSRKKFEAEAINIYSFV